LKERHAHTLQGDYFGAINKQHALGVGMLSRTSVTPQSQARISLGRYPKWEERVINITLVDPHIRAYIGKLNEHHLPTANCYSDLVRRNKQLAAQNWKEPHPACLTSGTYHWKS